MGVSRRAWLVLAGIVGVAAVVVVLAPAEQTIGTAIKYVYVHVALTRAGMWGLYLAGILGVVVLVNGRGVWRRWAHIVGWVALGLFIAGGLVSLLAEQATWGGIPWGEPRNVTTLNVIALGLAVLIVANWLPWPRVAGALYLGLALYVAWVIPRTELVLHPDDPISGSSSLLIPLTFGGLTLLAVALGGWLVWQWSHWDGLTLRRTGK